MVDLAPGSHVSVENPNVNIDTSMPGKVDNIWLKEGPSGPPGRSVTSVARTSGTGAPGTLDTYTISFSDGTTSTFQIYNGTNGTNGTNGRGITSIARTSGTGAAGTTDTYTITFTDATTSTFNVVNGANGATGRGITTVARTSGSGSPGATDTYTITYSDATTSTFTVYNGANGTGTGDVVGPASSVDLRIAVFSGTTGKLIAQGNNTIGGVLSRANHTGTQAASTITGLGTAATVNTGTASGEIPLLSTGGVLPIARLATGTPDGTKFVRDDGTLATPAGGGGSGLLASTAYNPASVTNVTNATTTFTDVDATNLTVTFTVPASGAVIVSLSGGLKSTGVPAMWGVGVAGTVVAATTATMTQSTSTTRVVHRVKITGLTSGASVTYRWMHANGATSTTTTSYGGTGASAVGQALMEIWAA